MEHFGVAAGVENDEEEDEDPYEAAPYNYRDPREWAEWQEELRYERSQEPVSLNQILYNLKSVE